MSSTMIKEVVEKLGESDSEPVKMPGTVTVTICAARPVVPYLDSWSDRVPESIC